jgi:AAA domain
MTSQNNEAMISALLDTIIPDAENIPYFRGVIYGAEGSTKTVTACTVGTRVLLIETDPGGSVSLFNHPEIYRKVTRMRFEGLSQIQAIAENINDSVFDKYDTLVIDTVSQMVSHDLDVVTKSRLERKKIDEEVPDWPAYRLNQNKVRRAITHLAANARKHIVMTSHSRAEKDKSGLTRTTLDMPQAVRQDITRICHLVGYMTADIIETNEGIAYRRQMQVHPTKLIVAKSRIGGLPVVINDPNLGHIVSTWVNSGAKSLDSAEPPVPESEGVLAEEIAIARQNSPQPVELEI